MNDLNSNYWSERYLNSNTGWDLGEISPPIKAYVDNLDNKNLKILIPGCGNGYEGVYLWQNGFNNTFFLDWSSAPLEKIKKENPDIPKHFFLNEDFFSLKDSFDLIIEQTMFCAIDPKLRPQYAKKIRELLKPCGKLIGLMFNKEFEGGPPFGGSKEEYFQYFSPHFNSIYMEPCYNSIEPRMGSELFVIIKI